MNDFELTVPDLYSKDDTEQVLCSRGIKDKDK